MKLKTPILIINAKTYLEASGKNAITLASHCKEVATKNKTNIALCFQATDIAHTSKKHSLVLAQHIDIEPAGGHTGLIHIKSIKENGGVGSLINHSEKRISFKAIAESIALLQEANMLAIVCVKNCIEARRVARLQPDAIAIEPPKLIGGDVSVTTANPNIISRSVKAIHKINPQIPVLCGAGIKNDKDVKKAIELGASGVLVASGVVKSKNQKKAIENVVKGLR